MRLKVKDVDIATGAELIVIINQEDAELMDLHHLDRVKVKHGKRVETCVINIAESKKVVSPKYIGLFEEVLDSVKVKNGQYVDIKPAGKPLSLEYIRKKLDGEKLTHDEIHQIVWDIVHNKLSDTEITYFVAAGYTNKLDLQETVWLTEAMAYEGDVLKFNTKPIMDKHCVGGVAGNRTTMIVVPIIAAAGLKIPKTSSRSITSPAGTADTVEVLANVSVTIKKMKKIVNKTKGCFVWGGSLNLAPADDKIIHVERPLSIDARSQLLASVLSKKASVSASHLLIDIPIGEGSKMPDKKKAIQLKKDFIKVSKALGIKIKVILTDGTEPIGNGIGPALEARDAVKLLQRREDRPMDLEQKSLLMAGIMLEMGGKSRKGHGYALAKEILDSGKAYTKFIEIIKAQGGKEIQPEKIWCGTVKYDFKASKSGTIKKINNTSISKIARAAGAPKDKGAGMYLYKHVNDKVKKGEPIFTIYAHNENKMQFAKDVLKRFDGIEVK